MMQTIAIQPLASQRFSVPLDGNDWEIGIRDANGTIVVSLSLNNVMILENTRAVAGKKIIPYRYLESGNFAIITQNFEIPDYTKFGTTQVLVYISEIELALVRAYDPDLITLADFDPNGAIPLRFSPKGYVLA